MLIVCPSCATTYTLTEAQLGLGRTLRCASCRHTWHATPADAVDADAAEPGEPALQAAVLPDGGAALLEAPPVVDTAPPHEADPRPPSREKRSGARAHPRKPRKPPPKGVHLATVLARVRQVKPWQAALVAAGLALVAAVLLREPLVRMAPQTARLFAAAGLPVNLRGLALDAVRSELIADKDQTVIVVEGTIRNVRRTEVAVPPLALTLRGRDGGEVYAWTADAPHSVLAAGESTPFRTRVVAPPLDAGDVLVRFARNDDSAPAAH